MNIKSHYLLKTKSLFYSLLLSAFIATLHVAAAIRSPIDYPSHAGLAESLFNGAGEMPPHFLLHGLIILIHKMSASSFLTAIFISAFLCVFVASFIVHQVLRNESKLSGGWVAAFTFAVFFVHPVFLVYPHDGLLYQGYIAPNTFHNPTLMLLKPLALIHFILFCAVLKDEGKLFHHFFVYLLLGTLAALTAIAKPSYLVVLVPGFGLVVLIRMMLMQGYTGLSGRVIILGATLLPGLAVLIWQYLYFFVEGSRDASIGIGFLGVYSIYSDPWTIAIKPVSSILFPLSLIFVMGRKLTQKIDFQLSAAMLLVSMFYAYFIVELYAGEISSHGNWWWSAQLANYLFFFVCIKYYFVENVNAGYWKVNKVNYRVLVPGFFLLSHLVCGLIWYFANIFPKVVLPFGRNLLLQ